MREKSGRSLTESLVSIWKESLSPRAGPCSFGSLCPVLNTPCHRGCSPVSQSPAIGDAPRCLRAPPCHEEFVPQEGPEGHLISTLIREPISEHCMACSAPILSLLGTAGWSPDRSAVPFCPTLRGPPRKRPFIPEPVSTGHLLTEAKPLCCLFNEVCPLRSPS